MKIFNSFKTLVNAFTNEPYQHVLAKIWRRVKKIVNPSSIHYKIADSNLSKVFELDRSISYDSIISFITPVYNPNQAHLKETIESVLNQTASNWELCLHDDGSTQEIKDILSDYDKIDARIKLSLGKQNLGIVQASNKAIQLAEGQYIAFLDHDDCIHPDTVRLISKTLQSDNKIKLIYTNENSININGIVESTLDKLPFGHHTLRSANYINHLTVINKHVGDKLGWLREDFEGAQDYDLLLRATESLQRECIVHIPKALYHWRMTDNSISKHVWAKKYVDESAQKALNAHLQRLKTNLTCKAGRKSGTYQLVSETEDEVFILIDLKIASAKEYLQTATSLIENTSYTNFKLRKPDNWDTIHKQLRNKNHKSSFVDQKSVDLAHDDYFICVITQALSFPQPHWLKNLAIYIKIDSKTIAAPLITYLNNKVFCDGLFYYNGELTNLYQNLNKNSLLDYFSGITKDVNGIYNICYLCANTATDRRKPIVVSSQSEVKLSISDIQKYGVIIAQQQ